MDSFAGSKIRVLKRKCENEHAQFLISSLTKAFDAIHKKFLHQLAICFYEGNHNEENLVEYYIFKYEYKSNSVELSFRNKNTDQETTYTLDDVKKMTVKLIDTCNVMAGSRDGGGALNNFSVRLYYNADAPDGYQAPGFNATSEDVDQLESSISKTTDLGYVATPFHSLQARAYIKDLITDSNDINPFESESAPMVSEDMELTHMVSTIEEKVNCPCHKFDIFESSHVTNFLTCQYCKMQQHAVCFGLLGEMASKSDHCCVDCYREDPSREPTDHSLVTLRANELKSMCIFRRLLALCSEVSAIGAGDIVKKLSTSEKSAHKLMALLFQNRVIEREPGLSFKPQIVLPDKLKQVISHYFYHGKPKTTKDITNVIFISQESQPDPTSDILSEKNPTQNLRSVGNDNIGEYQKVMPREKENIPVKKSVAKRTMEDHRNEVAKKKRLSRN
ncbi:unnamed protein product [Leptosia nina]|uniref:HORMA domain-containing protein n=1 Tax=Leptosia nina TaxID=320188 RepID=A0AAV1J5W0_9NEOP